MRLSRTALLARLTAPDVPPVVLLEAPPGYGKSWLARRALDGSVLRLRGELGPLARPSAPHRGAVLIDDAHLLSTLDVDVLGGRIEDAGGDGRLVIAGRLLADELHEAAELVDGLVIDCEALSITPGEITAELTTVSSTLADRLCEAADGSVRVIATSLDQAQRDQTADAVAIASQHGPRRRRRRSPPPRRSRTRRRRSARPRAGHRPPPSRTPRWPRLRRRAPSPPAFRCAARSPAPSSWRRASALRTAPIDPAIAGDLANDMLARGRDLEAIGLVLDAGDHHRATAMMKGLSESVAETVEPRPMLSLLARLGSTVDREPELLLLRAGARRSIGRVDEAVADIDRAVDQATTARAPVRRRVAIESARARGRGG